MNRRWWASRMALALAALLLAALAAFLGVLSLSVITVLMNRATSLLVVIGAPFAAMGLLALVLKVLGAAQRLLVEDQRPVLRNYTLGGAFVGLGVSLLVRRELFGPMPTGGYSIEAFVVMSFTALLVAVAIQAHAPAPTTPSAPNGS